MGPNTFSQHRSYTFKNVPRAARSYRTFQKHYVNTEKWCVFHCPLQTSILFVFGNRWLSDHGSDFSNDSTQLLLITSSQVRVRNRISLRLVNLALFLLGFVKRHMKNGATTENQILLLLQQIKHVIYGYIFALGDKTKNTIRETVTTKQLMQRCTLKH